MTVRRTAALQLLVLLAVYDDGRSTAQVIEALWPGVPAHTVTARVYTTVSDLRRVLRAATGDPVVVRHGDRYTINRAHLDVDLWRLRAAVRTARSATEGHRVNALRTVIDLHTGDLATGHTWPWAQPARETIRRHVVDAYAALADTTTGEHAVALLRTAITVEPFNQDLHHRAAAAMTAAGEHSSVPALLDTYRQRLTAAPLNDPPNGRDGNPPSVSRSDASRPKP